jgi:predicted O-methyltransferase YrrM
VNPVLEDILQSRLVRSSTGAVRELSGEVSYEEGLWLQNLIEECEAVKTLEIGLWFGVSALFICEAIANKPGARHIVMDPNQFRDCANIGLDNMKAAGYADILEFYDRSSHIVLPKLEEKGTEIDFAFLDGSHLFDYTLLEFFYIDRMLKVGGIIAFDDFNMPGVQRVCRFVSTNRSYRVVESIEAQINWKQRIKYGVVKSVCQASPSLRKLIRLELQDPDIDRGLMPGARYMAFKKIAHDSEENRPWHFYRDF